MASGSQAQRDPRTHLNSIQATSHGPLIGVNSGSEVLGIVKRVHSEMGVKLGTAASLASVKESQYCAALNGTGNFSIVWLFSQELPFVLRFMELAMEQFGLDATNRKAVRALRILELTRLLTED